jgi:hypothetical protein
MEEKVSKKIAELMLAANSANDIKAIITDTELDYWFANDSNWKPYGGREKNWDTVGNQQANAVGSLVELITNAVDAILQRKAREAGVENFRSAEAPQSMFEAVKRYFPHVVEGRIANLGAKQRTELAEKCVIIGVKRASRVNSKYPTYTIIDRGDGQLPDAFPNTFLSLSERNKEGIPFVQGKFNMGSTGSLRFCTSANINLGHYKLLISKHPGQNYWGWTLIRVRKHRAGESLPVAEYFCPANQIPRFRAETLQGLGHPTIGVITDGTIIKLYEYDVGAPAHTVDIGLYDALTVSLVDCALPVRVYDFDAKPVDNKGDLRKEGIAARTFSGMNATLVNEAEESSDDGVIVGAKDTEWQHLVLEDKTEDLGVIKIVATGVKKLKDYLLKQPARVFYTVNGQRHAVERASFLNTRVGLGDIRNHVIINVICDRMDTTALSNIFMPDRERKVDNNQSRQLEETVINALRNDEKLRAYAAEIRMRRATEYVDETEESKELLEELVKSDPDIKELFGLGAMLPEITHVPGGSVTFIGKKFPTILEPLNLKPEGKLLVKEVPINATRKIECGTDAENEYLSRIDSPGETWCSLTPDLMPHSVKVRNGTATFTIKVPASAKVGDTCEVEFGFVDNGRNVEPLKFGVLIRYIEAEASNSKKGGKKTDTKAKVADSLALPKFDWVDQADWDNHSFDENSGAYVAVGDSTVVYVNRDNKSLRYMRVKEKDEAARQVFETMFKYGLGIFALSIHRKATLANEHNAAEGQTNSSDVEDTVRVASDGIAAHIITVIKRLGGGDLVK